MKPEQAGPIKPEDLAGADSTLLRNYAAHLMRLNRRREAEPMLETLIQRESRSPEDASWARTLLGVILSTDLDPERSRRALDLIGLGGNASFNVASLSTMSTPDLRSKARVLAVQRDKTRRDQAVKILEAILEREPSSAEDLALLAQMKELDGNWPEADKAYQKATDAAPREPRFLIAYIQALLRQKQLAEIDTWLDRLDQLQGDTPIATQMRALVYQLRGDPEKAGGLLLQFGRDHPDQMVAAARVLEQMGLVPRAQTLLQEFLEKNRATNPVAMVPLAELLGRQGRTREAIDLCEPLWKIGTGAGAATVCMTILLNSNDDAQVRRVEARLQEALSRSADDPELLVARAILKSVQGQPDEAVALYRQILARTPDNVVALNNMAWILSFGKDTTSEALTLIERAIARIGQQASFLDTRAVVHLAQGNPEKAIQDLEVAVASAPEPAMYFHLARARLMADQPEPARLAWVEGERMGLRAASLDPLERPIFEEVRKKIPSK
jgi:tetratricopeptide (TPR) repeat protein